MSEKQGQSEVAKREEEMLAFWQKNNTFEKSIATPAGSEPKGEYTFYDGPPFATGTPHYGHLLASAIKDAVPRFWTMQGYSVKRQWGWDCHGLPIENIVEKELGISGREDIEKIGVKKFNDTCREQIFTFVDEWKKVIPRMGRWADMENPYRTMDTSYMESEWWAFKQLHDKGLIYEGYRSMHICPRCETTLSQSEVAEGYKDIKDLSVIAKFELVDEPGTFVLAWTTTPWTLPGNVALAVGEDIEYEKVKRAIGVSEFKDGEPIPVAKNDTEYGESYWIAKDILKKPTNLGEMEFGHVFGKEVKRTGETKRGKEFIGKAYKPLFDYYAKNESLENHENGWKIYAAAFVTTEDGTGVVHIAPAFGQDDMELGKKENLPFVQHVDMSGRFKPEVIDFAGMQVKPKDDHSAADVEIIKYLAHHGTLFSKEKYEHSYPHCWRCDTPLLNYATSSWFVAVEKIKSELLKTAENINWSPAHRKEGRFGDWLAGARDWSISRQRYWANTMPVWRCDTCEHEQVFGSVAELEEASGAKVNDLHKDVVDGITFACTCGGTMRRIPDVLDTWFNSGSVPFASLHAPFENEEEFKKRLPVDFIGEGQDQTRAWFYYLHVLSTALFDTHAFANVVVNGIVLAEDGKKMSKKLQNYPDPMAVVDTYGADAVRLHMLGSPAVRAENLAFSEKEVGEISRKLFGRLVNVYEFYALYKESVAHTPSDTSGNVLDRWILARLAELREEVTIAMEGYALDKAVRPFDLFIDDLSTWYVRRSRDRFKAGDADSADALATTAFVLREFAQLLAPFAPFHAEWLWQQLRTDDNAESVHLSAWPTPKEVNQDLLTEMKDLRLLVSLALQKRADAGINVRQPLQKLIVRGAPGKDVVNQIIADEVNVKEVVFDEKLDGAVALDTEITPELKEEGEVREIIRAIQSARKEASLTPGEKISLKISAPEETIALMEKFAKDIKAKTDVSELVIEGGDALNFVIPK